MYILEVEHTMGILDREAYISMHHKCSKVVIDIIY